MANRGASAAVIAAASASTNRPIHLVEVALSTGSVYMTDSYRTVTFNGNSFVALGHLLSVDGIEESYEVRISKLSLSLSGVDQVWIANVLGAAYIDRKLKVWKGFLNTTSDELLVDPVAVFDGLMDSPTIAEDPEAGTCTVTIEASSRGSDFERRPGRHTNDTEQQTYFPGDTCFKFVAELNRTFVWGKGGDSAAAKSGPPPPVPDVIAVFTGQQSSGNQDYSQWPPVDPPPDTHPFDL